MEKIRAFIALEMPDTIRAALNEISFNLRKELSGMPLRWVPVDNMHLTLKFLGDISADQVPAVTKILGTQTAQVAPFELNLDGLGTFPSSQRARVLWVGVDLPQIFLEFQDKLESQLSELGFTSESRPFSPHLTLARVRGHARSADLELIRSTLAATPKPTPAQGIAGTLTLFRSELKPSGSVYNALSRFDLVGRN